MLFEWDEAKNRFNKQKHDVWFEEAKEVFFDIQHKFYYDVKHSTEEERYVILGLSGELNILVVFHTYRDEAVRIISARHGTKKEKEFYIGRRIRLL
jgi:uncharacterized DUF497 family protein